MTMFETVTPKEPTFWAWQFDGTQESVDAFNQRSGFLSNQQVEYVSPTEARFGMVRLMVDDQTIFVVQVTPAGETGGISYYEDRAAADAYYAIS
jgi:hypothetical protein